MTTLGTCVAGVESAWVTPTLTLFVVKVNAGSVRVRLRHGTTGNGHFLPDLFAGQVVPITFSQDTCATVTVDIAGTQFKIVPNTPNADAEAME